MNDLTIPKKCVQISKKFIKRIDKYGNSIDLIVLKGAEPKDQYELLYGQSEPDVDNTVQFKVLLMVSPNENVYKDSHLETRGDAIIFFMAYSMQDIGMINETLESYLDIPEILIGNHIRVCNDYYRIDEVKQSDFFMEFPLVVECSLTLLDDKSGSSEIEEDTGGGESLDAD